MRQTQRTMKCMSLVITLLFASSSWANDPNDVKLPLPGRLFPFSFEGYDTLIQVPTDYSNADKTPIIFYYHGMGGKANVDYLKHVTESKGFILVGMSYAYKSKDPVPINRYTNILKNEVKRIGRLKKYLERDLQLNIDSRKMFISGISKGGWFTNDVFERRPGPWAGALIIAAGRGPEIAMAARNNPQSFKGKSVYIGVGETDTNRKSAERARSYLKNAGVDVTFEIYKGLGHAIDPESTVVRQWLKERLKPSESKQD